MRQPIGNRGESPDSPFKGTGKFNEHSLYKDEYKEWPLEKRQPPEAAKMRKPLPFEGDSEFHDRYRPWSPEEMRSYYFDMICKFTFSLVLIVC